MKIQSTRREFLSTTSLALAGVALGAPSADAQIRPANIGRSALCADSFLPESLAEMDMRLLATSAVDAARQAGATFSDIRIAVNHTLSITLNIDPINPAVGVTSSFTYGLRTLVDGAWAFVYGTETSVDAIAQAARNAVSTARGYANLATSRVELMPTPVVTGEWTTPIELDPFTVPIRDQSALLSAYGQAGGRVLHGTAGASFRWIRETRVFASSDGSLTTQTLYRSDPYVIVESVRGAQGVRLFVPSCVNRSGGYEAVAISGVQDEIKRLAEEAVELLSLPERPFDVGRFPVVMDGATLGAAFARTVGTALEFDRVLGYEADASGTSYLAPPAQRLGTSIMSPLLTVSAHRAPPAVAAVKWDDDGVEAKAFPVVTQGRLVNYFSSRETASRLQKIHEDAGIPMQSQGCARAEQAYQPVTVRTPQLVIAPGERATTLSDLCRDLSRGLLIRDTRYALVNQQQSSGMLAPNGTLFEIARGKIVGRVNGMGLQFTTDKFWKSITSLGGASTTRTAAPPISKGQPWYSSTIGISAPAGLFKDVSVISTSAVLT